MSPLFKEEKNHSVAQIEYASKEANMLVFRVSHQGENEVSASFPLVPKEDTLISEIQPIIT